jgi:NADH dehydrogenase ubiquinone Fe-S protein 4
MSDFLVAQRYNAPRRDTHPEHLAENGLVPLQQHSRGECQATMTRRARIYLQPKTAMQSGRAGTREWVLDFEPSEPSRPDELMGWNGSGDTQRQVRLRFAEQADAIAYAEKHGLAYEVEPPRRRRIAPKAYADNFRFGRREGWTH